MRVGERQERRGEDASVASATSCNYRSERIDSGQDEKFPDVQIYIPTLLKHVFLVNLI